MLEMFKKPNTNLPPMISKTFVFTITKMSFRDLVREKQISSKNFINYGNFLSDTMLTGWYLPDKLSLHIPRVSRKLFVLIGFRLARRAFQKSFSAGNHREESSWTKNFVYGRNVWKFI